MIISNDVCYMVEIVGLEGDVSVEEYQIQEKRMLDVSTYGVL